ncbi:hypothetical protein BJF93_07265 [Xaviernesmea oryzae]|uniref:SMP-30/Gluconolactonase/LRE-like region domain-containing protein n=1 Tax=Xaviernesmea oryzae TaxID=464029 RepID=A0A1Q9AW33_9HYPH|nr:SMP-30/gluconolactonase/LRE family protein [Xaviernesmea oryzae]OLP59687.1 hypothetical protein BJF93_07265 [Xaviernesmea oryzae]SEM34865.1 Sugar lactone lactonase YvrE [Xaviernesmea oryzae]
MREDASIAILPGPSCQLGEGPGYDPATDTAWWFDILNRDLHRLHWESRRLETIRLPGMASMMAKVAGREEDLIAMDQGVWLRDPTDGRLTLLAELNAGPSGGQRTNDGRVHPSGALWIGSMAHDPVDGEGSIHLVRGTQAKLLFSGITIPNSICFSPDGTIGYFADTREGIIWRVPIDPETGDVTGEKHMFHDGRRREGGIDGSVVDRHGYLWNARWGTGDLECFDPDGKLVKQLHLPVRQPTCPAFVGPGGNRMIVTSAAVNLEDTACEGHTLVLEDGCDGLHDAYFRIF